MLCIQPADILQGIANGVESAIDFLVPTVPNAKNLKAEALIDPSVLTEAVEGTP